MTSKLLHEMPIATPAEVRVKRTEMGLTQTELAALMGVHDFSVYRWETGKRAMTVAHTRHLRDLFAEWEARQRGAATRAANA